MIAHVIAPSGGIETALVDLSASLVAAGHRVSVYACRPLEEPNQNVARLRALGVPVRACPSWLARIAATSEAVRMATFDRILIALIPLYIVPALVDALLRRRTVGRSLLGFRGRLRGWILPKLRLERLAYLPLDVRFAMRRPDVVHVHGWGCGIDPPGGLAWARSRSLPTVYTEHNSPPESTDRPTPPSWLHLANGVIACSHAGARGLRAASRAEMHLTVIPYSVADPTGDALASDRPSPPVAAVYDRRPVTVTCLARLSAEHKGQDVLLRALRLVLDRAPSTRLIMAGEGQSRGALVELAGEVGVEHAVLFLGHVPRAELPALMNQSDIMVLPSRWEGLPVSIIESMAFGKPVVASAAGGNPELVAHGETGLIVPVEDPNALAAALIELIEGPARRTAMGAAARRRFAEGSFEPAAIAEKTLAVYQAAMGGGGRSMPQGHVRESAAQNVAHAPIHGSDERRHV